MTSQFWNERYNENEYAYGTEPNQFFAKEIQQVKPGRVLFPCDGEGRNSVYAAILGWDVIAFDFSEAGKTKADQLAAAHGVSINFQVADAALVKYPTELFDLIVFTFAHLPVAIRQRLHAEAVTWLKPGGRIIFEAYNPKQLNNNTGGPKDISMLVTPEIIHEDFGALTTELLQEIQEEVHEGKFHNGLADVIQYIGIKDKG